MLQTFEQFLQKTAEQGGSINTLFEERLFALVGTLEKIAGALAAERIPYEVIGGMAVMIQVQRVDPSAVRNTKDIDILVQRADLERIKAVAEGQGFKFRHSAGVDMLLPPGETKARSGVHLVFTGERFRPHQALPNPRLRPEHLSVHGVEVAVIAVADLVRMKLSTNRDIDRVHIRDLDSAGLITAKLEEGLPPGLRARLQQIRRQE
jgi:hypothetical protein